MVKINGRDRDVSGATLAEYLKTAGYDPVRIAVERNDEIVPKEDYGKITLMDGDIVEVVSFVGGG